MRRSAGCPCLLQCRLSNHHPYRTATPRKKTQAKDGSVGRPPSFFHDLSHLTPLCRAGVIAITQPGRDRENEFFAVLHDSSVQWTCHELIQLFYKKLEPHERLYTLQILRSLNCDCTPSAIELKKRQPFLTASFSVSVFQRLSDEHHFLCLRKVSGVDLIDIDSGGNGYSVRVFTIPE